MNQNNKLRRDFLKTGFSLTGYALLGEPMLWSASAFAASQTKLSGASLIKFTRQLVNPLAPAWLAVPDSSLSRTYTLSIEQTSKNLGLSIMVGNVPTPLPATTVWGYRGNGMSSASYPGPTFDLSSGSGPIKVNFVNNLVTNGKLMANPMPVDTSIDWANPGSKGALAPIPVTTHLHGGDNRYAQDGLPDAWVTPGLASRDSQAACGQAGDAVGTACTGRIFASTNTYDNSQAGGMLWYHDHALGVTRTNVYMGLAGLYFLRENVENQLRADNILPSYPYEVPLVLQDRMFDTTGQLYYPATAPAKTTASSPSVQPEFFGDVILANAQAWPVMSVEPRPYRFRILNGSDSRAYELSIIDPSGNKAGPTMMVIGNDLGLLNQPALPSSSYANGQTGVLAIMPGERYDVIIDFSSFKGGAPTRLIMKNTAPAPYYGGAKPITGLTDQVMAFDVKSALESNGIPLATIQSNTVLRTSASLPAVTSVPKTGVAATRRIFMYEGVDKYGRLQTMLGTVDPVSNVKTWDATKKGWIDRVASPALQGTLTFQDDITEIPKAGTTEVWEFYNTTVDSHPLHMHLVDFRIINREPFSGTIVAKTNRDGSKGGVLNTTSIKLSGMVRSAGSWEAGRKDTVQCHPGEVTRVLVSFNRAGEYVYHCHILSHEDHEMMRRYLVV